MIRLVRQTAPFLVGLSLVSAALGGSRLNLNAASSRPINAFVALSIYGTMQSRAEVCPKATLSAAVAGRASEWPCLHAYETNGIVRLPAAHAITPRLRIGAQNEGVAGLSSVLVNMTNLAAAVLNQPGQGKVPIGPD